MSLGVENEPREPNPYEAAYEADAHAEYERYHSYKAVNALAVVSLGLGLMSALTFLHWQFGIVGVLGIVLGAAAIWQIKQRPHELAGLPIAYTGVILSAILLPAGIGWLTYVYHTEVPEGYTRIHYDLLRPTDGDNPYFPPQDVLAWDGTKVFLKGYMFPSNKRNVSEFTLCRDNKDCCFGGEPKWYDMVRVKMVEPKKAEFSDWQRKIAGVLRVMTPEKLMKERQGRAEIVFEGNVNHRILYYIDAKYIK